MDVREARVIRRDDNFFLELDMKKNKLEIPLTEDKQNEVKKVFNELIVELKKGEYEFELKDIQNDLYCQISYEYITQLNSELHSVYSEMKDYDLLETNCEIEQ